LYIFGLKGFKDQRANLQIEEEVAGCNDLVLDLKFIKMADAEDPRNNLLVIASNSETLRIFDLDKKRNLFVDGHSDMILSLDTRQEFIMSGSKDTTIKLWKLENEASSVPSTHPALQLLLQTALHVQRPPAAGHFARTQPQRRQLLLVRLRRQNSQEVDSAQRSLQLPNT